MGLPSDSEYIGKWVTQVRKGLLDYCVIRLLGNEEKYGYQLVQDLKKMPNLIITEGTIYPILAKLKKEGLLQSELKDTGVGPTRRYYKLTKEGINMLKNMNDYWENLSRSIEKLR